jgi:hypothetical protein
VVSVDVEVPVTVVVVHVEVSVEVVVHVEVPVSVEVVPVSDPPVLPPTMIVVPQPAAIVAKASEARVRGR